MTHRRLFTVVLAAAGLAFLFPAASFGSLIFYTTQASFNSANPGLPVQTFTGANTFGQLYVTHASPIDSTTNDAVFPAGTILPGITIANSNPGNTPGLIIEAGSVGNNYFGDALVLSFTPGVSAVGVSFFANTSPGQSLAGSFTEAVYSGQTFLGSANFSEVAGGSAYAGVFSTTPITGVRLLYTTDDATTFASSIAFGSAPSAVPEPSAFIVTGFGLVILGFVRRFT